MNGQRVLVVLFGLEHACHGNNRIALVDTGHTHTGCVPALLGDLVDAHPDDIAGRRKHEDLAARIRRERRDDLTARLGHPHSAHALTAPALAVERRHRGALAVTAR